MKVGIFLSGCIVLGVLIGMLLVHNRYEPELAVHQSIMAQAERMFTESVKMAKQANNNISGPVLIILSLIIVGGGLLGLGMFLSYLSTIAAIKHRPQSQVFSLPALNSQQIDYQRY